MKQIIFILISIVCMCSCSKEEYLEPTTETPTEIYYDYGTQYVGGICNSCGNQYVYLHGSFVYNTQIEIFTINTIKGTLQLTKSQVYDIKESLEHIDCGVNQYLLDDYEYSNGAYHCHHTKYNNYDIDKDYINILYKTAHDNSK